MVRQGLRMAVLGWPLRTGRKRMDKDPRAWDCGAAGGGSQLAHSGSREKAAAEVSARVRVPPCLPLPGAPGLSAAPTQKQSQSCRCGDCACVCECPVEWGVS